MRTLVPVIMLLVTVAAPRQGWASTQPVATYAAEPADERFAQHAVRGVVKVVRASALVVSRPGRRGGDMTFVITPSTDRDGTLVVGATVSVRYRTDGDSLIATAVTVHAPQGPASPLHTAR
jgi:hypothetical protein